MIGNDLKLWQKAALLTAAPLLLETVMLGAIYQAQDEVNQAYKAERAANEKIFVSLRGLKATLNGISDAFNYRVNGRKWTLYRCQRALEGITALRQSLRKDVENFAETPLDMVMAEVEELLKTTIAIDPTAVTSFSMQTLPMTSKLASKAMRASELTHQKLNADYEAKIKAVKEKQDYLNLLIGLSVLLGAALALTLALLFHRGTVSQIDKLMENISRMARREALLPAASGSSELARLDQTFHSMARNIESLTQRERSVLANSNELILLVSEDMKIDLASRSSETILERGAADLAGMRVSELTPDMASELEETKAGGDRLFELAFVNPSGREVELEVSATWSAADRYFYCVAHDIGARKELERLKQSFIAMVSHDLRSPISASQAAMQLLKSDPSCCKLTPEGINIVDRMIASNSRLLNLINDLLDIEKLEYGLITLEHELVAFNDLMYECLSSLQNLATAKNITIECDDSDDFVYCDSGRIVQVLVNIASNAIKVTDKGGKIQIKFRKENNQSLIGVIDHGPGIPPEFFPQLFDRYSQLGDDKALTRQGSGLGLNVAKNLVELHGGRIEVASTVGSGTIFTIVLPAAPARAVKS